MEDIGSGFFKLPELEYIQHKPKEEYDFPTSGLLHSDKFKSLLQITYDAKLHSIFKLFDGHSLQEELSQLTRNELADFCRHVLIINKDKIGWQVVDKYLVNIEKKVGKAGWEKPKFIFTDDFNQMLSSIYRWEMNRREIDLLVDYVNSNEVENLSKDKIINNLNNNYQFWSIRDIFLLFEDFISQHLNNKKNFQKYQHLLKSLENLIMERITTKSENLKKRITFLIIFSRGLVKINFERFQEIQEITARIWIEIENSFDKRDVDSYRYLFSVVHAHLGANYYQYNIDFIHKRQLINLIIATFFEFPEVNIGEWLNKLVNTDVEELIIEYILHGYLTVVTLLDEYTKELPKSDIYTKIHDLFLQVTRSLLVMSTQYLIQQNNNEDTNIDPRHLNSFRKQPEKYRIIKGMIRIKSLCVEYLIYYDENAKFDVDYINTQAELQQLVTNSHSTDLTKNHLLMLMDNYPFQDFLTKIEYEVENTNSIVNSKTFEREIIILTSSIMEEIRNHYNETGILLSHELDKLLYYIAQWLQYFKQNSYLYQDFVMICSPIITIIMVQLVQAYHEMNKNILAFLMYLNMQHFASLMRGSMDLIGSDDQDKPISYYASDFRDMIHEWDITFTADLNQITDSIKTIQSINQTPTAQSGMLEDELLMEFVRLTGIFEEMIKAINKGSSMLELETFIEKEATGGSHLYQRIGQYFEEPLNFPLIKNIHIYNAALSIVPVEINISASLLDLDIESMIAFFFREEEIA